MLKKINNIKEGFEPLVKINLLGKEIEMTDDQETCLVALITLAVFAVFIVILQAMGVEF